MPVKCDEYNHVCVMAIEGNLVADTCAHLRKSAEEQLDRRQIVDFVLDFEKCEFIDSEGLQTLLWLRRRCEDLFGQLKLVNLDEHCRKILEITRLEARFECHSDLPTALRTMR